MLHRLLTIFHLSSRMLDGVINDRVEGLSLQHAIDKLATFNFSPYSSYYDPNLTRSALSLSFISIGVKSG